MDTTYCRNKLLLKNNLFPGFVALAIAVTLPFFPCRLFN